MSISEIKDLMGCSITIGQLRKLKNSHNVENVREFGILPNLPNYIKYLIKVKNHGSISVYVRKI